MKQRIAAISDLHGKFPEIEECDILLICGDIVPLHYQSNTIATESWYLSKFLPWCRDIKAKNVVFIAGNHEVAFEKIEQYLKTFFNNWKQFNIYYLNNETIEINGIKIFGTPYCKKFGNWAYMKSPEELTAVFSEIPENIDILMSHDAPKLGNCGVITEGWNEGVDAGNVQLAQAIIDKKPKINVHGHIHSSPRGPIQVNETTQVFNVSYLNEYYEPTHPVLYFDYETN